MLKWLKSNKNRENHVCNTCARLESRIVKLESESLDHYTALEAIRDKVLRKIQYRKPKEEEQEDTEAPKNSYTKMLLPGE